MNWVIWAVGVPSTVLFWLALLLTWLPLPLPDFLVSPLVVWCLVAPLLSPFLKPTESSEGRVIYGLPMLNLTWTMIENYHCFQPPPNFALAPDQLPQVAESHHAFGMALLALMMTFPAFSRWPKLDLLPAGCVKGPDDSVNIVHSGPNQFTVNFNDKPVQTVSAQTYQRYRGSLVRPVAAWAMAGWFALMFFPVRPRSAA